MVPRKGLVLSMQNSPNRKKALAYIRISSERQVNNESPETQKATIIGYADKNNIEIVEWFYDEAKSGKNVDRPELIRLMEYAAKNKNKIDYVIVFKMNRAGRDMDSYISGFKVVLKAMNIYMRSATEPVDESPTGEFVGDLMVLLGQLDNRGKAETTKLNMRSLASQGYWQHPPPIGYETTKIPNEAGKLRPTLKPNHMAPKVKQVLERFSTGDISKADLTRYAKKIGLRSRYGTPLAKDSIHRLLSSPIHAGKVVDSHTEGAIVDGKHEGIVDWHTFERNQRLVYGQASRAGQINSRLNPLYPLKGTLICSNCSKPLYGSAPKTGSGGRSPRYHCSRSTCKGKVVSLGTDQVHDDFKKLLQRLKPSKSILKLYREILLREAKNELSGINKKIGRLRRQLDSIAETRVSAIEKFANEMLEESDKELLFQKLDDEKSKAESELDSLEEIQNFKQVDIQNAINFMTQVDKQWAITDLVNQQRFQNMIFPGGLTYNNVSRTFGTNGISPLYRYVAPKKAAHAALKFDLVALVHSNWNHILSELNRWKEFTTSTLAASTSTT